MPERPADFAAPGTCQRIARLAAEVFGATWAAVCIRHADGGWDAYHHGVPVEDLAGLCAQAAEFGFASMTTGAVRLAGQRLRAQTGSDVGVLCLSRPEERPFTGGERHLLAELSVTFAGELAASTRASEPRREPVRPSDTPALLRLNQTLLEHTPDLICTFSRDGYLVQVSASSRDILGYEPAEIIGRNYRELMHPDDVPRTEEATAAVLATGTPLRHFDTRYIRKNGDVVYLEWNTSWSEEEGQGYAVGRDITELKLAEAALRESEERYRIVIERTGQLVYDYDVASGHIAWQGAIERITGFSAEAFARVGIEEWTKHLHPDDQAGTLALLKEAQDGFKPFHVQYRFRDAKGEFRHMEDQGIFLPDAGGRAVRMLGVMRDISAEKQAEAALRETEARNRATLEALPDLMFRLSRAGDHLDFHAPVEGALAVPSEQILGKNLRDLLPSDLADAYLEAVERTIRTGSVQTLEYDLAVTAGGVRSFEANLAVSSRDEVVVIVRDMTERVRHAAELVQARQHAEEMSRLKSAFLANMSHEIRTPLTSIIGFADLLSETVTGEGREFADLIQSAGNRLLDTINSVLDLAQLESGTLRLRSGPMDFVKETREVIGLFMARAERRGLHLAFHPDERILNGSQDRAAVGRVLANLIGNAIKFTEQGEVTVTLRRAGADAEIEVADTGIGIDPEFLPHLFDEFRQESDGFSRRHEGNGLGLAITSRLVELMGGTMHVRSTKGVGTTFTVRLPLGDEPATDSAPGSSVEEKPSGRLLVVDDLPEAGLLVSRMLAGVFDVDTAEGFEDALAKARSRAYDAVLVDINLGGGRNGLDLLRVLRTVEGYARRPIVACTAYTRPGDEERMREEGFDAYASKPLQKAGLQRLLGSLVSPKGPV